jgi:hypothetical protein
MPFPNQLQTYQGIGVQGDFASANPNRFTLIAGQGAFVSGPNGLGVGLFSWVDYATGVANNYGNGPVSGFVHREQQGLITVFLAETSMLVPPGNQVTIHSSGDFLAKNAGTTAAVPGMKAYANYATGAVTFAATGNPPTGAVVTGAIATNTATFTGSIAVPATPANAPGVMTVTAIGSGVLTNGAVITGLTGVATGTTIVGQLTGTTGGIGTYEVSIPQTVVSSSGTATNGTLTVTAVASGSLAVGQVITGSGVTTGTTITQLGTGTGGTGTYYVNISETVASETLTVLGGVETKWTAFSFGQPGELVKISSTAQG